MILFTGLTGTSGKAFVDLLIKEGFSEHFRAVVRTISNTEQLKNSGLNFEMVCGDIDDEEFITEAAEGCDTVFHIAAKAKIAAVARAVAKTSSVKQCIFVSSTSIYSNYRAASDKVIAAEEEMKQLFTQKNISWTLIRPTMIFGSREDHNISTFMHWLNKYPLFPIVKKGAALLQPVNKNDLAQAYYLILSNRENVKNKEYIVSGERAMSLKETLRAIGKSIGKNNTFINVPMPIASFGANMLYILSFKRLDIREKLFRLSENRAFEHTAISEELGYSPKPFEYWIGFLADEYLKEKKNTNE